MFCRECGAKLTYEAKFCTFCGAKIDYKNLIKSENLDKNVECQKETYFGDNDINVDDIDILSNEDDDLINEVNEPLDEDNNSIGDVEIVEKEPSTSYKITGIVVVVLVLVLSIFIWCKIVRKGFEYKYVASTIGATVDGTDITLSEEINGILKYPDWKYEGKYNGKHHVSVNGKKMYKGKDADVTVVYGIEGEGKAPVFEKIIIDDVVLDSEESLSLFKAWIGGSL